MASMILIVDLFLSDRKMLDAARNDEKLPFIKVYISVFQFDFQFAFDDHE